MRNRHFLGVVVSCLLAGCAAGASGSNPTPEQDLKAFGAFKSALENTLVEVNELERMGGGIRDRMILVDAESLVPNGERFKVQTAIRDNFGKIRSLRESLENNESVLQVLRRSGHTLDDLVAIDARGDGVVILYFND